MDGSHGFAIEFRMRSAPDWPNRLYLSLFQDFPLDPTSISYDSNQGYLLDFAGETSPGSRSLRLFRTDPGAFRAYQLGNKYYPPISEWHVYRVERTEEGNWKLWIDGIEDPNYSAFVDSTYSYFNRIVIYLFSQGTQLDWIRLYGYTDSDMDGYSSYDDCNDTDSSVNPGAPEVCDGRDNNCDGVFMSGELEDADADGFLACEGVDCNDQDATVYPGALELPGNYIDEDCNGDLGQCDPNLAWKNHGQYVRCVAHDAEALVDQGWLSQDEGDALVSSAAQSSVGKR